MQLDDEEPISALESMKLNGTLCDNHGCSLKIACARYYNPDRSDFAGIEPGAMHTYNPETDDCYHQRRQLAGTPDVLRQMKRTTKRHRKAGGSWI